MTVGKLKFIVTWYILAWRSHKLDKLVETEKYLNFKLFSLDKSHTKYEKMEGNSNRKFDWIFFKKRHFIIKYTFPGLREKRVYHLNDS